MRPSERAGPMSATSVPLSALKTRLGEPPLHRDTLDDVRGARLRNRRDFRQRSTRPLSSNPPHGPMSLAGSPSKRFTFTSPDTAIVSSREPSGVVRIRSLAGHVAPDGWREPPRIDTSHPAHVCWSQRAARIFVPSPVHAYTVIPRVSGNRCVSPVSMTRT